MNKYRDLPLVIFVLCGGFLAGCCSNQTSTPPPPPRFEVISEQRMTSKNHSDFTIMVIKDTKTEKEFKVIHNSSWGVVPND